MLATFLQEAVEETAEQMPEEKTLSFIELILDGGIAGTTVIAILFVLLVVAL